MKKILSIIRNMHKKQWEHSGHTAGSKCTLITTHLHVQEAGSKWSGSTAYWTAGPQVKADGVMSSWWKLWFTEVEMLLDGEYWDQEPRGWVRIPEKWGATGEEGRALSCLNMQECFFCVRKWSTLYLWEAVGSFLLTHQSGSKVFFFLPGIFLLD